MRHAVTELADVALVTPPSRPAVVFCIYTSFGYGHLARLHRIADALLARAPVEAYVVGGHAEFVAGDPAERPHEVLLPGPVVATTAALRELPAPEQLSGLRPGTSAADLSAHKSRLLLALVQRIRPAAIVIDSFPFAASIGRDAAECEETLAYLAERSPGTLRCAGFRGIDSLVLDAAGRAECRRLAETYLDLLLLYIDGRERTAFFDMHPHLQGMAARTRFVGYVAPRRPAAGRPAVSTGARLLATFGSGVDGYEKIRLACDAALLLAAARPDATLDVVTGGRLPDALFDRLAADYGSRGGSRGPIRLARFVPGLSARLDAYDLVIAMGGYNTCVELYAAGGRSIALPRVSERNREQWEEAEKFQAHGGIDHVVDSATTTPAALAALIADTLRAAPATRAPLDLNGAIAAAELLHGELERRGALSGARSR